MKLHHAYEGTKDGTKGVWTDELPEGVIVEREFLFIEADDANHELKNKETGEIRSTVIISDESEMDNWEEVEAEKPLPRKEIIDG